MLNQSEMTLFMAYNMMTWETTALHWCNTFNLGVNVQKLPVAVESPDAHGFHSCQVLIMRQAGDTGQNLVSFSFSPFYHCIMSQDLCLMNCTTDY